MNTHAPMNSARPTGSDPRSTAGILESSAARTANELLGSESVGLLSAGIDPRLLLSALLTSPDLRKLLEEDTDASFPGAFFPEGAKRKVEEDESDEDDEEESDDDDVADDEEDEDDEEDDADEEEDEEDDEDEDEEEDEFDDPDDDDDDFDDDDDDEDDFDDDE